MRAPPEPLLRAALWATAGANLGVAALVLMPRSLPAQLAGFPPEAGPAVHRVLLAAFIALFGGAYAWLARRPRIDRVLLGFAAIGKALAFASVALLWMLDLASGRFALLMSGDLLFATLFAAWLFGGERRGP